MSDYTTDVAIIGGGVIGAASAYFLSKAGIQTLVDGAALGFTASLWGVAMSLVTNVYERWQEHQVTNT